MVSIIPGMENLAPERTETRSGSFLSPSFLPMAFSLWDGFNRERGNKRGLTRWVSLFLEPGGEKSTTGPVIKTVAATLLVELIIIGLVRRRYRGTT